MDIDKDLEYIEQQITERNKSLLVQQQEERMQMPNFVPELDKTKNLEDQASDVVKVIGAQIASRNEVFMKKVADNFAQGVITEQETKQMKNEMLLAEQFFIKWEQVLKLAHIKEAQGLGLMLAVVYGMFIPYWILRLIGFVFMVVSEIFEFFNTLFNAVFGNGGEIMIDNLGKPVINPKNNKPYRKSDGYNIFAKFLLGTVIIAVFIALVFLIIDIFTGVNIFKILRSTMT